MEYRSPPLLLALRRVLQASRLLSQQTTSRGWFWDGQARAVPVYADGSISCGCWGTSVIFPRLLSLVSVDSRHPDDKQSARLHVQLLSSNPGRRAGCQGIPEAGYLRPERCEPEAPSGLARDEARRARRFQGNLAKRARESAESGLRSWREGGTASDETRKTENSRTLTVPRGVARAFCIAIRHAPLAAIRLSPMEFLGALEVDVGGPLNGIQEADGSIPFSSTKQFRRPENQTSYPYQESQSVI
jgi:hypothetical protein